jgi:hypothetical protein
LLRHFLQLLKCLACRGVSPPWMHLLCWLSWSPPTNHVRRRVRFYGLPGWILPAADLAVESRALSRHVDITKVGKTGTQETPAIRPTGCGPGPCRRTDLDPRSTPPRYGKYLVRP